MVVPSYVPEPIEVPNNVAKERFPVRAAFIRRVVAVYLLTVAFVAAIASVPIPKVTILSGTAAVIAVLLAASAVRGLAKGRRMEVVTSSGLLIPLVLYLGMLCAAINSAGHTIWPMTMGLLFVALYTLLCGRDLSFIAMFFFPAIASTAAWIGLDMAGYHHGWPIGLAILTNIGFLFYFVYDLAALLTRRRLGEEMGAVVDLYRDILNFTTYWIRVVQHWKKYPVLLRESLRLPTKQ